MTKKLLIFVLLAAVGVAGMLGWEHYSKRAEAMRREASILDRLTEDEVALLFASGRPASANENKSIGAEARAAFLNGLAEYLALAADARREGLAETDEFKLNAAYKRRLLLAELYQKKRGDAASGGAKVDADQIAAVWSDAANPERFERETANLRAIQADMARKTGNMGDPGVLHGESLERAKQKWATAVVLAERAEADPELMSDPEVVLRLELLDAGILSFELIRKYWEQRIKATPAEFQRFIADRPEYDLRRKYETAESIRQRIAAGESFEALAAEFSEHRPTRGTGGLMENQSSADLAPELAGALADAAEGTVLEGVITTDLGFHIVKLEKRKTRTLDNGSKLQEYTFRHILLQNKFEQPGFENFEVPAPFMTAEEIAVIEIEKEKRRRFVAESVARNNITLPADFTVPAA